MDTLLASNVAREAKRVAHPCTRPNFRPKLFLGLTYKFLSVISKRCWSQICNSFKDINADIYFFRRSTKRTFENIQKIIWNPPKRSK